MPEPIRWGILGAGQIAAKFVGDLTASAGSVPVAVAAREGDRATAFASQHGLVRSYGSYRELVEDPDLDVIYIATTHAQHHEHALLALRSDKAVLVEKAFTLNARQAHEVVAEARMRQRFCMEAMWMRFHPLIGLAQQIALSGELGEIVGIRADLSKVFDYDPGARLFDLAAGGGALLDLGVYPATLAWLLLGRPDTVHASGSIGSTGTDHTAAMQWGYADGRVGQIYCSATSESPYAALLTGTAGWIRFEGRMHHPSALTVHTATGDRVLAGPPAEGNGFGPEIAEVERCLRAGVTESRLAPLEETVAILEILDQARRQLGVRYQADQSDKD
ncbi:MAG: Gfo/Idh/MocA family oxidoreductase [Jatrophihabitantaceae bacterium]